MLISNNSTNLIVKYISIIINQEYNNSCNVTNTYKNNIYNDFKLNDDCICSNLVAYNETQNSIDKFDYCKIDYVGGNIVGIIVDDNDITESDYIKGYTPASSYGSNSILRKKRLFYQVEVTNTCYGKKLKKVYKDYLMNPSAPTTLTEEEIQDLNDNFIITQVFPNGENTPEQIQIAKKFYEDFEKYNTSTFLTKEINDNDRFFENEYSVAIKEPVYEIQQVKGLDDKYFEETVLIERGDIIYCRKSTMKTIDSLCANIAMYLNSRYPTLINRSFAVDDHTVINPEALTEVINSDICRYFCGTNESFNSEKLSFNIDDFIASFILGRTITPYSSMEDINYVQKLMENNIYISYEAEVYGEWDSSLTNTLYQYQKDINERYKDNEKALEGKDYNILIPTGYFDIITEKYMLQDRQILGEDYNNAYSSI